MSKQWVSLFQPHNNMSVIISTSVELAVVTVSHCSHPTTVCPSFSQRQMSHCQGTPGEGFSWCVIVCFISHTFPMRQVLLTGHINHIFIGFSLDLLDGDPVSSNCIGVTWGIAGVFCQNLGSLLGLCWWRHSELKLRIIFSLLNCWRHQDYFECMPVCFSMLHEHLHSYTCIIWWVLSSNLDRGL